MPEEVNLEEVRAKCETWDDELEMCLDDYPEECPYHAECQKEAESENEE